jgi:hypothetical protein
MLKGYFVEPRDVKDPLSSLSRRIPEAPGEVKRGGGETKTLRED